MNTGMLIDNEITRQVLDNVSTAVLVFAENLKLEYMNPSAEMLFAVSARKVRESGLRELMRESNEFEGYLHRAIESGQGYTEHEFALTLPDGKQITVDCTVTAMMEGPNSPYALVELQHVDRHLRISREESLMAQNVATRALIRGVAHEVKNPLGGLRGAAQLLERELPNEDLKEYTRIIIGEADRLQVLADNMLGPNNLPNMKETNIHEVLERVRSITLADVPEGIEIIRDYDPSIPEFNADRDQLIQAVLNIVGNAVQALNREGVITLRTRIDRQYTVGNTRHRHVLRLDVIDNGPGIPDDLLSKIFYPMVTNRAEGTGLGLSISQSIVNRHGGIIECESKEGETIFTIRIPLETE